MSTRRTYSTRKPVYKKKTYQKRAPYQKRLVVVEPRARRSAVTRSVKEKPPGILSAGGSALGAFLGGAPGSFLGGKLGHLAEKITGFGDYQIEQNSIMAGGMTPPQVVNSVDKGGVIVRHREFIGDITASTGFNVQSFLVNPGLARTFPWLSQVANSYEQYKLRGMLFEFNSTSSDALLSTATSTALGSVIMSTDYDVADLPPSSKREMLNSEWASSSKPSSTFIHPIECKKSVSPQSMLYTRGAISVPSDFDQRLYDFCRFNIATEGMQVAGGNLGELWVTYEIELYKQQFSYIGLTDHFRLTLITTARPLGTAESSIAHGGTMGGGIDGNGLDYNFPIHISSGQYLFTYAVVGGSSIAGATLPTLSFTNCVLANYWTNNTLGYVDSPEPPITSVTILLSGTVRITGQNAQIAFAADGVIPNPTNFGDLWVTRIADSITF